MDATTLAIGAAAGTAVGAALATLAARARRAETEAREAGRTASAEATARGEQERRADSERRLTQATQEAAEAGRRLAAAQEREAGLQQQIDEQRRFVERARADLENTFKALATDALRGNQQQLLTLSDERQKAFQGAVLDPLRATLDLLAARTEEIERVRAGAYGRTDEHVRQMIEATQGLRERTSALETALRGSQVQGRWGEVALRNLAEFSGMIAHCDFLPQATTADGRRPDMTVRLPGGRMIAVDAKAPLTAYLEACGSASEPERKAALSRHVAAVRGHARALRGREYAASLGTPEALVVMFLPADSMLAHSLQEDPGLFDAIYRDGVLLASPTTLLALLRTFAAHWQEHAVAENAARIAEVARELYDRVRAFAEHLGRVGAGIAGAADAYNAAQGSYQSRLLPVGKRLEELKVPAVAQKPIPEMKRVEPPPRTTSENRAESA